MAYLWMEARCSDFDSAGMDECGFPACHQTGPGSFARLASVVVRHTKQAGWVLVDDKWICPACQRASAPLRPTPPEEGR